MKRFLVMAALIGAVVVMAGCSKKQQTAPPSAPVKAAPVSTTTKAMPAKPITSTAPLTRMKAPTAKSAPKPATTGGG